MKTVMGWIDKIVSSLARRKVNKDEAAPQQRAARSARESVTRLSRAQRSSVAGQNERHPVGRRHRSR